MKMIKIIVAVLIILNTLPADAKRVKSKRTLASIAHRPVKKSFQKLPAMKVKQEKIKPLKTAYNPVVVTQYKNNVVQDTYTIVDPTQGMIQQK